MISEMFLKVDSIHQFYNVMLSIILDDTLSIVISGGVINGTI